MQSQNIQYNNKIDDLRGLACLMVFIFHFRQVFNIQDNYLFLGFSGVFLFFVLSGFLFTIILLNKTNIHYGKFLANRVLRIFPMYLLAIFWFFTMNNSIDLLDILRPNMLNKNFGLKYGILWTIGIEFYFYLLIPFIIKFTKQNGLKYLIGLLILFIFLKNIMFGFKINYPLHVHSFIGSFHIFLMGCVIGVLYHRGFKVPFSSIVFIFSLFILILLSTIWAKIFISKYNFYIDILSILCCITVISFLSSNMRIYIQKIGKISFSIYILHYIVFIKYHMIYSSHMNIYIIFFLSLISTLILSTTTYFLIEKPFMSLRKKY